MSSKSFCRTDPRADLLSSAGTRDRKRVAVRAPRRWRASRAVSSCIACTAPRAAYVLRTTPGDLLVRGGKSHTAPRAHRALRTNEATSLLTATARLVGRRATLSRAPPARRPPPRQWWEQPASEVDAPSGPDRACFRVVQACLVLSFEAGRVSRKRERQTTRRRSRCQPRATVAEEGERCASSRRAEAVGTFRTSWSRGPKSARFDDSGGFWSNARRRPLLDFPASCRGHVTSRTPPRPVDELGLTPSAVRAASTNRSPRPVGDPQPGSRRLERRQEPAIRARVKTADDVTPLPNTAAERANGGGKRRARRSTRLPPAASRDTRKTAGRQANS